MESQPQNHEFRNNPENFHPCLLVHCIKCQWVVLILKHIVYRGSYMIAHVLSNLSNKLKKRDETQGLSSILTLFRNKFNKLLKNCIFCVQT